MLLCTPTIPQNSLVVMLFKYVLMHPVFPQMQTNTVLIATMHQKERVIAPLLQAHFQLESLVPVNFNTDMYGMFSGEIERKGSPVDALRLKCQAALALQDAPYVLASEGSFGPHPAYYFMPANEEFLLFMDVKNGWEVLVRHVSTHTNFNGALVNSWESLTQFAQQAQFPEHGLIIRRQANDIVFIQKGITDWEELERAYRLFGNTQGEVFVETDMRAMFNPTRMQVIEEATLKLINKLKSTCPQCHIPGFDITETIPGLPCSWCGLPTKSVLKVISTCAQCAYREEKLFPFQKEKEDPGFCDYCNP